MENIPLIIPNFNQLTYLQNLILWWRWYYPKSPVWVLDNASTYPSLLDFYEKSKNDFHIIAFQENDCPGNLRKFLDEMGFEWYVICDPDIMPHPATPPNFLEIFHRAIKAGYHHAGFDLITEDLPDWLHKRAHIVHDESLTRIEPVTFEGYASFRAAIDTTFCLYWSGNGGWSSPMPGNQWTNGLRLFKAFHFKWYQHKDHINPELHNYFTTSNYRDFTKPSAGRNYFRPPQYEQ